MDNCLMQIVYLGELFARGTMCQVSSLSARLVSGPLVEFQMRPQIQRSVVPLYDWSLRRGHKNLSTSK